VALLRRGLAGYFPITWFVSNAFYYGQVDAQNKFMGKSFEIRPTGVAHANLLLPKEWAPSYPKAKGKMHEERVVEHYSWKKVTTNVSGFILGSPTIDHYGDMIVRAAYLLPCFSPYGPFYVDHQPSYRRSMRPDIQA
jgi:hypothetical protein